MKHRKPEWTPFIRGTPAVDPFGFQVVLNSRYQVHIKPRGTGEPFGTVVELSVKRRDKEPIYDWRDMQRMKNELFGRDVTMVQVFPPEKYLVDTANQYNFFVFADGYELPFGFKERLVTGKPVLDGPLANTRQRPFDEPHHVPDDLKACERHFEDVARKLAHG